MKILSIGMLLMTLLLLAGCGDKASTSVVPQPEKPLTDAEQDAKYDG